MMFRARGWAPVPTDDNECMERPEPLTWAQPDRITRFPARPPFNAGAWTARQMLYGIPLPRDRTAPWLTDPHHRNTRSPHAKQQQSREPPSHHPASAESVLCTLASERASPTGQARNRRSARKCLQAGGFVWHATVTYRRLFIMLH
jgi:hypothetical protein